MLKQLRQFLNKLPRTAKRAIAVVFDFVALSLVIWLAYSLRLGGDVPLSFKMLWIMAIGPAVAIPVFFQFGIYRAVIRFLPERYIWTIIQAMLVTALLWVAILFLVEATRMTDEVRVVVPRSVPIFYWLFGSVVIAASRFGAKRFLLATANGTPARKVLIYGAGPAGTQLAASLRSEGAYQVAGFIDDDPGLVGRDVSGVRVHSSDRLTSVIRDSNIAEVILSIPSLDAGRRQKLISELGQLPVTIRALPAISDLASGKYLVSQLREIDIDDLLGRSSVPADPELLGRMLDGRVILVTGAGGSIGSELTELIVQWKPQKLILLEANEFALYQIERRLKKLGETPLVPILGSVGDAPLLARLFATHAVDAVFHTAAHKHVPLVEANALEGVRNNVFGTDTLVRAAAAAKVKNFVLISTDKAVHPTNVMGASKRWAELIVRHHGQAAERSSNEMRFCAVRFGNVLGSNGSVVPLFREQIAAGGPVTLTDERMTRYFMSIHEAAELIVQAGALSEGSDIFLLEMGEPVHIRDLAENMIRLAGLTLRTDANPQGDIAIAITGIRPGEKLTEELFYDPAKAQKTRHPKILRSAQGEHSDGDVESALAELGSALEAQDEAKLRDVLFGFIRG